MPLTPNDISVIQRLSHGHSVKMIAYDGGVCQWRIYETLKFARRATGVHTDAGLVAWAIRAGLIT